MSESNGNGNGNITFSTCWYQFKAKFDFSVYAPWIRNMLSNVRAYNLVIYTDDAGKAVFDFDAYAAVNPRIRVIMKPFESFRNYALKDMWIANHSKNLLLNKWVDWRVNALWSEKVHFVNETATRKYFDTEFYGWCDIGYFRGRTTGPLIDLPMSQLRGWPKPEKIAVLNTSKIYYGCVNNDWTQIDHCIRIVNDPKQTLNPGLNFIAGGFFMLHKTKAEWWAVTYDAKLHQHLSRGRTVKDDQQIIADCVFSKDTQSHFHICREEGAKYDVWFLFQRALM
uniref:Uncharacterized protein n=1 Tax=viral metagenome TaxID=1070528 RepID=A0A6C0I639_9ZZZZ